MSRTEQDLNLYEISDKYILFLQNFKELTHIYNPASVKPLCGNYTQHTRKYIGVVIKIETDDKKSSTILPRCHPEKTKIICWTTRQTGFLMQMVAAFQDPTV